MSTVVNISGKEKSVETQKKKENIHTHKIIDVIILWSDVMGDEKIYF